ncbi:phage tail tip lysozyme [Sphingomonas sp. AR_OL41]|uniref:phage tail tip lysozyme n=1 Tax=Sphingomonas sp. AR_OL41 TaxID=3042729 RepID=UPI0024800761|nr:phage tail tip lysozyme [Sphingomonas sp. AR_OL41]MDH7974259.1 phage tail tip lysozyme [Sphingomonas sp. AR_OL41]
MPIVPVEENKVGVAGLTDAKLRPADYSGSGLEALGAGLAGVGKAGSELADSLPGQEEAKRRHAALLRTDLAAKRAWNEGHEANAALLDGFRQFKGKDARDALAPVAEAMAQNLHAVRQGHEDAHVRAIIDGPLAHRTAQDIMDLHAHADAQDAIAQAQESERVIANSATEALRHADDPTRFDHAIATGENTLRRQGELAGKPEAAIDGDIATWRSARYVEAVHALAPRDGLGATALFERYRDQLTPADRSGLEPLLHEPMAQTQAIADIDTAALAAAPFAPLTPQGDPLLADRMRTITSHFDRVLLPELMQRYGGDAARAWAATQIGTDAVDDLVKQHGDGWYQALPEAARNGVAHNFALLKAGSSARTAPQDRAAVAASLAGLDDTRRGYAQRELTLRSNRADQARRAAQGVAADQAYAVADQLGHDFTSLAQLPAKVRADLSDQTSTALQRQADANIDPQPVAPEGAVSLALRNMATTAPEAFRDLDMREYRPLVSADEYAMFERLQRRVGLNDGVAFTPPGPGVESEDTRQQPNEDLAPPPEELYESHGTEPNPVPDGGGMRFAAMTTGSPGTPSPKPRQDLAQRWRQHPELRQQDPELINAARSLDAAEKLLKSNYIPMLKNMGFSDQTPGDIVKEQTLAKLRNVIIPMALQRGVVFGKYSDQDLGAGGYKAGLLFNALRNAYALALNDRQREALRYFTSKEGGHWTPAQAAGIVANLTKESRLDSQLGQEKGGPGYGIAQWERGKERALAFKALFGIDISRSSFRQQLAFVNYELTVKPKLYREAGDDLRKQSTPAGAGNSFSLNFEAMKNKTTQPVERANYAIEVFEEFYGKK